MDKPLINIITRTSSRPNAFKRCINSIRNQTYKNINQIIITDDKENINYIKDNDCSEFTLVNREEVIEKDKSQDPHTGPYSPHNLYFNEIKGQIEDGWIIYLDDDDLFVDNNSLQLIVNAINEVNVDTIIYWRMIYGNGSVLPLVVDENNPPKMGGIGGSCFTIHSKYLPDINWDSWKCSDFRVITHLHELVPNFKWVNKSFIFVPVAGMGNKKDSIN